MEQNTIDASIVQYNFPKVPIANGLTKDSGCYKHLSYSVDLRLAVVYFTVFSDEVERDFGTLVEAINFYNSI